MTTASIIIIGDEILSAKFQDENTPWLLKRCAGIGIKIVSVRIIPDVIDTIATVVREESERVQYVFTTGGIGPTHDDLTYQGIAKAFNQPLKQNERIADLIKTWFPKPTEDDFLMALLPENAVLIETNEKMFPQITVNNVFIFPGVPKLLQRKFARIEHLLEGKRIHREQIGLNTSESNIAGSLREIQDKNQMVTIGSYPRFDETPSLIITVDGENEVDVLRVVSNINLIFKDFI